MIYIYHVCSKEFGIVVNIVSYHSINNNWVCLLGKFGPRRRSLNRITKFWRKRVVIAKFWRNRRVSCVCRGRSPCPHRWCRPAIKKRGIPLMTSCFFLWNFSKLLRELGGRDHTQSNFLWTLIKANSNDTWHSGGGGRLG